MTKHRIIMDLDDLLAFRYFPQGGIDGVDLDAWGMGFEEIVHTYDPLKTFVRLVNHRSDFLRCYLIRPEPGDAADV